jgi:hypothetical protein
MTYHHPVKSPKLYVNYKAREGKNCTESSSITKENCLREQI